MSDREQRLARIAATVCASLSGAAFEHEGSVFKRVVGDGIVQLVEFRFGYGGPDVEDGVDPADLPVDPFKVQLGARVVASSAEERLRVGGLEVDVRAGLGQASSGEFEYWFVAGHPDPSDPYWQLRWPEKAAGEITRLLDSAGERWFSRFDTFGHAMATLETLSPLDYTLTDAPPRVIALRIYGERGDHADAQRVLDQHVTANDWPPRHLEWLAERAELYGIQMPPIHKSR
ncbi:hypothetical protein AMYBAR_005267 [Amycolatopsis bartoniae]|uniref:Uncharacterized protein n=1 Tax=Amycolatopsis bartoniae TaxID=941986 RepID=A0A8H9M6L8_9PSEU|nr:hypothetical protein [Amycolatopsis bartoniae]TVT11306.1 hypothetical protein FNH07_02615 [Amycolatopsis bartoniae]GHF66484.1 hypothetical protein GCM10017566_45350 [Amycolatopsis bartoniae]